MTVVATARPTVADAMVAGPKLSPADVTVDGLRALFASPKVHSAVLLDGERLVAVVDRVDVEGAPGSAPAVGFGRLGERVAHPGDDLDAAWERLLTSGRRRLAVVDASGRFLGLLCLKRTRAGFCSDRDVRARVAEREDAARSRERGSGSPTGSRSRERGSGSPAG